MVVHSEWQARRSDTALSWSGCRSCEPPATCQWACRTASLSARVTSSSRRSDVSVSGPAVQRPCRPGWPARPDGLTSVSVGLPYSVLVGQGDQLVQTSVSVGLPYSVLVGQGDQLVQTVWRQCQWACCTASLLARVTSSSRRPDVSVSGPAVQRPCRPGWPARPDGLTSVSVGLPNSVLVGQGDQLVQTVWRQCQWACRTASLSARVTSSSKRSDVSGVIRATSENTLQARHILVQCCATQGKTHTVLSWQVAPLSRWLSINQSLFSTMCNIEKQRSNMSHCSTDRWQSCHFDLYIVNVE